MNFWMSLPSLMEPWCRERISWFVVAGDFDLSQALRESRWILVFWLLDTTLYFSWKERVFHKSILESIYLFSFQFLMGPTSKISDAEITSFLVIEVPFTYFNRKVDLCVKRGFLYLPSNFLRKTPKKGGKWDLRMNVVGMHFQSSCDEWDLKKKRWKKDRFNCEFSTLQKQIQSM